MTLDFFSKTKPPLNPLQCKTCSGRGQVKTKCETCYSKGYVNAPGHTTYYACHHCGNLRCHVCGGDGIIPRPQIEPSHLT